MATSTNSVIDAIKTRLSTELPAKVTAQSLPTVLRYLRYEPDLAVIADTPYVWMRPDSVRAGGPAAFGDGGSQMQTRVRNVIVGIDVAGEDSETTQERVEAFGDLIWETLEEDQIMGGTAHRVRVTSLEFRSAFSPGMQLFARGLLRVELTRWAALGAD